MHPLPRLLLTVLATAAGYGGWRLLAGAGGELAGAMAGVAAWQVTRGRG